jgi:hypothetical protein
MNIRFGNKEIPVTFVSSDHKIIPLLIQALHRKKRADKLTSMLDIETVDYIEVIGTEAYLYSKTDAGKCYLAL